MMLLFLVVIAVTVARQGATLLKKKMFSFFCWERYNLLFLTERMYQAVSGIGNSSFRIGC